MLHVAAISGLLAAVLVLAGCTSPTSDDDTPSTGDALTVTEPPGSHGSDDRSAANYFAEIPGEVTVPCTVNEAGSSRSNAGATSPPSPPRFTHPLRKNGKVEDAPRGNRTVTGWHPSGSSDADRPQPRPGQGT